MIKTERTRFRELGLTIGKYPTGAFNAITDVAGVLVGHATVIEDEPGKGAKKGLIRTGVTSVIPTADGVYNNRVVGGTFILNGAGEMSGLIQVQEWGLIETPILLTNTLAVGTCSEAAVRYMVKQYPEIGKAHDVVIPLVGECDDSWLNDIAGNHLKSEHVYAALKRAASGPVAEGSVGGGTGMITCDFKAGIGTASRKLPEELGGYTVGVLVMSNFGVMSDLRADGVPLGEILAPKFEHVEKRRSNYGSIIAVLATDAPFGAHQLNRLAKRVGLGIGRAGSMAAHGSGEIVVAFSTANKVPRLRRDRDYTIRILFESEIDPYYQATIEATEEAILNSLCMAGEMTGIEGRFVPGLPLDRVKKIMAAYGDAKRSLQQAP